MFVLMNNKKNIIPQKRQIRQNANKYVECTHSRSRAKHTGTQMDLCMDKMSVQKEIKTMGNTMKKQLRVNSYNRFKDRGSNDERKTRIPVRECV